MTAAEWPVETSRGIIRAGARRQAEAWRLIRAARAAGGTLLVRRGQVPREPAWVPVARGLDTARDAALLAALGAARAEVVELLRWEHDWERMGWDHDRAVDHVAWAVRTFGQVAGDGPSERAAADAALEAIEAATAAEAQGDLWRACQDLLAAAIAVGDAQEGASA